MQIQRNISGVEPAKSCGGFKLSTVRKVPRKWHNREKTQGTENVENTLFFNYATLFGRESSPLPLWIPDYLPSLYLNISQLSRLDIFILP